MPNSELSTEYSHGGEAAASSEPGSDHDDLKNILDAIASQLSDADRRHSATLSEMQHRIAGMERETEILRNHVPQQFAPAFGRIETGVAELAERLAGLSDAKAESAEPESSKDPKSDSPMALRLALDPQDKGARPPGEDASRRSFGIDTFDVIESSLPGNAADPWDRASADALTRLYRVLAPQTLRRSRHSPNPPTPVRAIPALRTRFRQSIRNGSRAVSPKLPRESSSRLPTSGPDHDFYAIGQRLDQFEEHFTKLFEGVATQADIGSVRLIEAHVGEVVNHLVQTHDQLARLNVIEEQLAVISHTLADLQGGAHPARFLDTSSAADELRPLIERLMSENRQGEENTAALLDTLQHAMIRLLDRVDSIESAQRQRLNPSSQPHDYGLDNTPSDFKSDHDSDVMDNGTTAALDAAVAAVASVQPMTPHRPEAPVAFNSGEQHEFGYRKNDKLRQDFAAEARRAKMRLAAVEPDEIIIKSAASAESCGNGRGRKSAGEQGQQADQTACCNGKADRTIGALAASHRDGSRCNRGSYRPLVFARQRR